MDRKPRAKENEVTANYRKAVEATAVYQAGRILADARHSLRAVLSVPYRLFKLAIRFNGLEKTQFNSRSVNAASPKNSNIEVTEQALALLDQTGADTRLILENIHKRFGGTPYSHRLIVETARIIAHTDARASLALMSSLPADAQNITLKKNMGFLYYKAGELNRSAALLSSTEIQSKLTYAENNQAKRILDEHELLRNGYKIPLASEPPDTSLPEKIMYVCHTSLPHHTNGYAIRTHNVAVALKELGMDIECVSRPGYPWDRKDATAISNATEHALIDDIEYFRYRSTNLTEQPFTQYANEAADTLYTHIQSQGITKVMAASNYVNALPALIAARRAGIPFVYDVRGLWEYTAASKKPNWIRSEGFQLFRRMETLVASEADAVITLSSQLKEKLVSRGVEPQKIDIALNAVSSSAYENSIEERGANIKDQLSIPPTAAVLGFIGSIEKYEGLQNVLLALRQLTELGKDVYFVLVGDGKYVQHLYETCCELNLVSRVKFVGRVNHREARNYYDAMDICIYPRLKDEVCTLVPPLKPLEAMINRKPVIISRLEPIIELVGGEDNVLFIEPDSVDEITAAINKLTDAKGDSDRIAKNGFDFVSHMRSWSSTGAQYSTSLKHTTSNSQIYNQYDYG